MKINRQHKGQVALVLVLIMTVVSALAVSLASRSTIDMNIQQTETESVQALLFAQTGLEQLIMNPLATSTSPNPNYFAEKSSVGNEGLKVGQVTTGGTRELNLVGADFGTLTVFSVSWSPVTSGEQPAVYISLLESSGKITDYAFAYTDDNGFTLAGDGSGGYAKKTPDILLNSNVVKVRITVLGSPAKLKVEPVAGGSFPPQMESIRSVGSVQSTDKTVKYGLQYDESKSDTVPAIFDYALFSGGSIIQ